MLTEHAKPVRRVSQAPLKFTTCYAGCGAQVGYRTNPNVMCCACKPKRRAEQMRQVAERQRRRRGVAPVKGTTAKCAACTRVFIRASVKAYRCSECQGAFRSEAARAKSAAKYTTQEGRDYATKWVRQKKQSDPAFALNRRIATYMAKSLRGRKDGRKWQDLVGFSLSDLMLHLERQFLPGMTWENRSEWHVDHIVPLSSFKFTNPDDAEFRAAWALTNLRPFWAADNLKKHAKRLYLI